MRLKKVVFPLLVILLMALPSISMADVSEQTVKSKSDANSSPIEFEKLLDLMIIGPRQLAELPDGKALNEPQRAMLQQVLVRLDDLPLEDIHRWSQTQKDLEKALAESDSIRGQFFRLSGNVVSVETVKLSAEDARRLPFKQYYRVRMVLEGGEPAVEVLTRRVPRVWLRKNKLDERASTFGMYLRRGEKNSSNNEPVFAARRVAWHPSTPLGELGMDVGLLESLRDREKTEGQQRECFYQMLAAVGRAEGGELILQARDELKRTGEKSFSVVPLFNEPAEQRGRLVMLSGTARRVVKVQVKDADIVQRLGIDYYYEIYLYTGDSQDNPLVFCVRYLPEGMPTGSGPKYSQQVKIAGFFLKTWAFRPEKAGMSDENADTRQLAPLLIGREPIWLEPQKTGDSNPGIGVAAGGLFILVLLIVWLAVWRSAKRDRQFRLGRSSEPFEDSTTT
ncbi:MAG: hypothetical protein JXM70_00635 [Pirellulales bacterium]|nr:hypothetical protein [Pirellulales bacterium]